MAYPRQTIRDYSGGLNTQVLPSLLMDPATGNQQFPALNNMLIDSIGRMVVRGGQRKVIAASFAGPVRGFYHFVNDVTEKILIATGGHVYSYNLDGTLQHDLSAAMDATKEVNFTSLYSNAFWTDGVTAQKWDGVSATAQKMGIAAPTTAPVSAPIAITTGAGQIMTQFGFEVLVSANATPAAIAHGPGQGGVLDSSFPGYSPYSYYYTFTNAAGLESNPSPASNETSVKLQKIRVTAIAVSTDPQVTGRNLYRFGGSSAERRFVATIADNTTTSYIDNIRDIDLSTDQLSFAHDAPPVGVTYFVTHKNRLLAAGDPAHPNRLYISSYTAPEYWPVILEQAIVDGGFFDVTSSFADPIVGLGSTGSVALSMNKQTAYALFGDSFEDGGDTFVLRKITDKGCSARKSIVTCINSVLYLAHDGEVYSIVDNEPTLMSYNIRATLKGIIPEDRVLACAYYLDGKYLLFFPRLGVSPIGFAYDFRTGGWVGLSDPNLAPLQLDGPKTTGFGGELWFATSEMYQFNGVAYSGIVGCLAEGLSASKIPISWTSAEMEIDDRAFANTAKNIRIEGAYVPWDVTDPLRVSITASSPNDRTVTHSYKFQRTHGMLIDTQLHADLKGRRLQISIYGNVKSGNIQSIELQYTRDQTEVS